MKRCGECGSKAVQKQSIKGKSFPFKDHPSVTLKSNYEVLTCTDCQNLILSNKDFVRIDALIKEALMLDVCDYLVRIKANFSTKQQNIAELLGVTRQYISELKKGKKQPSFAIVSLMYVLAAHPEQAVQIPGYKSLHLSRQKDSPERALLYAKYVGNSEAIQHLNVKVSVVGSWSSEIALETTTAQVDTDLSYHGLH